MVKYIIDDDEIEPKMEDEDLYDLIDTIESKLRNIPIKQWEYRGDNCYHWEANRHIGKYNYKGSISTSIRDIRMIIMAEDKTVEQSGSYRWEESWTELRSHNTLKVIVDSLKYYLYDSDFEEWYKNRGYKNKKAKPIDLSKIYEKVMERYIQIQNAENENKYQEKKKKVKADVQKFVKRLKNKSKK